jgi:hypothetical protein
MNPGCWMHTAFVSLFLFRLTLTTLMAIFPLVSGGMLRNEALHCKFSLQPGTHSIRGRVGTPRLVASSSKFAVLGLRAQSPEALYCAAMFLEASRLFSRSHSVIPSDEVLPS